VHNILGIIPALFILFQVWGTVQFFYYIHVAAGQTEDGCIEHHQKRTYVALAILQVSDTHLPSTAAVVARNIPQCGDIDTCHATYSKSVVAYFIQTAGEPYSNGHYISKHTHLMPVSLHVSSWNSQPWTGVTYCAWPLVQFPT